MFNLNVGLSGSPALLFKTVEFATNTALNGATGAASMALDAWAGSSILRASGHSGYGPLAAHQYANPALIGIPAGIAYHWAKTSARTFFPALNNPPTSKKEGLARFATNVALDVGTAALVGFVSAKTAEHRGDNQYLEPGHAAAALATGDALVGAVFVGAVYTLALCGVASAAAAVGAGVAVAARRNEFEMA